NSDRARATLSFIAGQSEEEIGGAGRRQIHQGKVEPTAVGTTRAVGVASGIRERTPERFGGDRGSICRSFRGHDPRRVPGHAGVKGTVNGNHSRVEVVPGNVDLAVRSDKGNGADALTAPLRLVHR